MATCVSSATIYAFANGSTTTKSGFTVPLWLGTSPPCSGAVLLSQAEYTASQSASTAATAAQAAASSAQAAADTAQANNTALQSSTSASIAAVNSSLTGLSNRMGILEGNFSALLGGTAQADNIRAMRVIFGATLAAACAIWGVKRLVRVFRTGAHDD